jgi:hypothetical protein
MTDRPRIPHDADPPVIVSLIEQLQSVMEDPLCDPWTIARLREMPAIVLALEAIKPRLDEGPSK